MNDFAYVAIIIAFFALAALFVKACVRIIGPDEQSDAPRTAAPSGDGAGAAAGAGPGSVTALPWRRDAMSASDIVGLVIAAVLLGYLIFALLFPEKL